MWVQKTAMDTAVHVGAAWSVPDEAPRIARGHQFKPWAVSEEEEATSLDGELQQCGKLQQQLWRRCLAAAPAWLGCTSLGSDKPHLMLRPHYCSEKVQKSAPALHFAVGIHSFIVQLRQKLLCLKLIVSLLFLLVRTVLLDWYRE